VPSHALLLCEITRLLITALGLLRNKMSLMTHEFLAKRLHIRTLCYYKYVEESRKMLNNPKNIQDEPFVVEIV